MKASFRLALGALALATALVGCGGSGDSGSAGSASLPSLAGKTADIAASAAPSPAPSGSASTPVASAAPAIIESKVQTAGAARDVDPFKPRPAGSGPVARQVALPALPADSATLTKSAPALLGLPTKVGVARPVTETADGQATSSILDWSPSPRGGQRAALRFTSSGAKGVRIGLQVDALPTASLVRFYADTGDKLFEVSALEILTVIQRNRDAGDASDAARTYWSPNLGGEAITLEIDIPPGVAASGVRVSVPALSHVTVDMTKADSILKVGESGSCNLDVSCDASYSTLSKSVALMDFISGGNNYVCTGTLLNDRMSTGTPYFLSANHCIATQTVASTLYTLWSYKSASCNSTQISPAVTALTTGATLLYASSTTDTSFMRLNSPAPVGAVFAGSIPNIPDINESVYGVHHPKGDLQKASWGSYLGSGSCANGTCVASVGSGATFLRTRWLQGTTEGGSSGSGLFTRLNGKDYLVGQLYGGYASCTNPFGTDYYGRLDAAYATALYQWLGAASTTVRVPIYRFYNNRTRAHFYTTDMAERDRVITKFAEFTYEGVGFYAYGANAVGSTPVHRFYNTRTGAHFYTIDNQERLTIQANYPWYAYEGTAWYANTAQTGGSTPMYRFYSTQRLTHFYTTSAVERDYIRSHYAEFVFEGVGYFAWTGL